MTAPRRKLMVENILQCVMSRSFTIASTKDYLYISLELILNYDLSDANTLKLGTEVLQYLMQNFVQS